MLVRNSDLRVHNDFYGFIGSTPQIQRLFSDVRRLAATAWPALLLGETGTGKELLAQAIHQESTRAEGPFVAVNCGALTPALAASELFGHVKGAFTGAATMRIGAFARAKGGTLFLDEVGDLPSETQAMLLRALETEQFLPVGSDAERPVRADVRIVAATHRPLLDGRSFRADLYHRLATFVVTLPPLRDRPEDIPLIAQQMLHDLAPQMSFAQDAQDALCAHIWPGNVRELRNLMRRVSVMVEGPEVTAAALDLQPVAEMEYSEEQAETGILKRAFRTAEGRPTRAAKLLGCDTTTFYRRVKRAGVDLDFERQRVRYAGYQRLLDQLADHQGNIAAVARSLSVHRKTVIAHVERCAVEIHGALAGCGGNRTTAAEVLGLTIVEFGALERSLKAVGRAHRG